MRAVGGQDRKYVGKPYNMAFVLYVYRTQQYMAILKNGHNEIVKRLYNSNAAGFSDKR
jgi:hypothetical protein